MKIVALLAVAACSGPTISGTTCTSDADCNLFNVQGTCQPTKFCSYPDATCAGGSRYSPGAGMGLGDTCIGGDASCGAKDQVCCGTGTCGANLTCSGEGGTCQCGGAGQACCDGVTCGSNLVCGAGAMCRPPLAVLDVAVGKDNICALAMDHTVSCWGYDTIYGYHAPGHTVPVIGSDTPVPIPGLTDAVEIRAAELHTCARKTDNTLWCWGHDEHGQLGDGSTNSTRTPVQVSGLTGVQMFDGGTFHTCAVGSVSNVAGLWCWGRGGQKNLPGVANPNVNLGRLGNNATADSGVPVAVDLSQAAAAGQTVKAVSTGVMHSCAVMSDNTVWCWGRNSSGELGNGTTTDSKAPVKVSFAGITIPSGVTVDQVSCSDGRGTRRPGSTCMLLSNGAVYCWGAGGSGQLGDNTTTTRSAPSTPVTPPPLTGSAKLVQIVSAAEARCARASDGSVWCWGSNYKGLLGIGIDGGNYPAPVHTRTITSAVKLDMSHRTACAIDASNQLWCWGNNQRGQITFHRPATMSDAHVLQPVQILP